MCNRARLASEPETLHERFGSSWAEEVFRPNRPLTELVPRAKAYIVRAVGGRRLLDVMDWDVLGGAAMWPMTNVRDLAKPQWRNLAAPLEQRCLIPLTEFCEFTPEKHDLGDGKPALKGEMWFRVPADPIFAVAGFWKSTAKGNGFAMVTCDPNELVAPIHPKAMVTILPEVEWNRWLSGSYDDVLALQRPYPAELMAVRGPVFPKRTGEK